MSSKTSVLPIVRDHFATFVDARTHRRRWLDYVIPIGLPFAAGVAVVVSDVRLQSVGDAIAGVAVFAGLLFALVIYVFQLRMQIVDDPRLSAQALNSQLVDELFANVAYSVLVGIVTTGILIAGSTTRHANAMGVVPPLDRWWSGVAVVACLHLLLTIAMCLKRTRSAYRELTA